MVRNIFLLILFSILLTSGFTEADWVAFRGPEQTGSAPQETRFSVADNGQLDVKWRAPVGPGYSSVVISGKHTVTLFSDGNKEVAAAYDTATGKELWRTPVADTYKGHDGSHDGPIATPLIAENRVISFLPRGELIALDLQTGKLLWSTEVAKEHGGKKPFYGYASSPLYADGVVVAQIGGERGRAFGGFDVATGKLRWALGEDSISYQSPILMNWEGKTQAIFVGDTKLFGIDPKEGKILWEYTHGGEKDAVAIEVMVPVPAGEGRLLLKNKRDSSDLVQLIRKDGKIEVVPLWQKKVFRNSYSIPVYHDGNLYGYNGTILSCVDASTGEVRWRSREPGDGFLMLVDGNLVVQTKQGSLHIGEASPEGWKEKSKLDLFSKISWSSPSFSDGSIFTRSHSELARVEWRATSVAKSDISQKPPHISRDSKSRFENFLSEVSSASDKKQVVDRFLASVSTYPLLEWPDRVYFLYRGEAQDMAIAGEMLRQRPEENMQRIEGTDLFYWSTRLEPDARLNYRFIKNFEENIVDPMNPRKIPHRRFKEISWFAMPGWKEPRHLQPADEKTPKGRMEAHELKSKLREKTTWKFEVYLPAGYEKGDTKYPVVYIFGPDAKDPGMIETSLNNLFHDSIRPAIAVIASPPDFGENEPARDQFVDVLTSLIAEELIPYIDSNFRTIADGTGRIAMGGGFDAYTVLFTAFKFPGLFNNVVSQSIFLSDTDRELLSRQIKGYDQQPMQIYMDWGQYDPRSLTEGWDVAEMNRKLNALFREKGYMPAGGEVREGFGWGNWRNRTDRWLALFLGEQ